MREFFKLSDRYFGQFYLQGVTVPMPFGHWARGNLLPLLMAKGERHGPESSAKRSREAVFTPS
jgi:hypothetical protein